MITIENMSPDNLKDIYIFETDNRVFFEKTLPPRPSNYFNYTSFEIMMLEILEEQSRGECFMHIIRNPLGEMIGRINIHSIKCNINRSAELGYRISESEQGKGYATEAVRLMLQKAFSDYDLETIIAGTAVDNKGSQRVLEKNAFTYVTKEDKVMKVHDQWIDGLLFEVHRS